MQNENSPKGFKSDFFRIFHKARKFLVKQTDFSDFAVESSRYSDSLLASGNNLSVS